ncbi:hypothetical protein LCGC14_1538440 [marine sediment metagenome]|uniref:RNA polymerase sigma-70 region 2 domain-containing protein n=1 Tax=marine sediment metagenome TaxID=412755 RepID=A0A0F9LUN4_9ZZZZ
MIEQIAKQRRNNHAFAHFTGDDIEQEIWAMCLDALRRYNPTTGPLEHFLNSHVSNRLKNLKRDKYFRPGSCIATSGAARTRMNLVNALPLDNSEIPDSSIILGGAQAEPDPLMQLLADETRDYITDRLPPDMKPIFFAVMSGNKIRQPILDKFRKIVAAILEERDRYG